MSRPGACGRAVAGGLVGLLVAVAVASCSGPEAPRPTAIVVLDVDTLRADALGCYGNAGETSPAIDRLAARGVRFEWAFSQAPYTLPSQASIVTGLYPWSHGVIHQKQRLGPSASTLAERFRDAGWRTAGFVDGGYVGAHFGFDQGFETFREFDRGGVRALGPEVEAWLRAAGDEPFLLFVHTYDPHTPYDPGEPYRSRFAARVAPPNPGFEPTTEALEAIRASQWEPPRRRLDAVDLAYARSLYDGEAALVDAWVERWMAALEQSGNAERTAVVLISDHGEEFQEHGSLLHEKLYSTVTRIPFVVAGPSVAGGRVVSATVESVDLLPTLLDLAGVGPGEPVDGRSLAATLRGGAEPEPRASIAHSPFWGEQRAVVDDEYHLIATLASGTVELFRYRDDRDEQTDLAASEPGRVRRLVGELRTRVRSLKPLAPSPEAELPPEVEESLRALGYLR